MATKKVKKFGRGGDILTGIGAGLAGYGIYKALTKGKEQDDEYTKKVKEYGTKGRFPEEQMEEKAAPRKDEPVAEEKGETKTDSGRNSNLSPVEQHAAITKRSNVEPSDTTPVDTNPKKIRVNKAKDRKAGANNAAANNAAVNNSSSNVGLGMAGSDTRGGSRPKSVVFKKDSGPKKDNATINRALKAPATDLSVPKGVDLKGTNKTVYGTDTTSVFQRKAAQERKEKEEAEARKKREAAQAKEFRERQLAPLKKGGMVKKYASGGSVKTAKPTMRSASSRADGIAIRGKTRA